MFLAGIHTLFASNKMSEKKFTLPLHCLDHRGVVSLSSKKNYEYAAQVSSFDSRGHSIAGTDALTKQVERMGGKSQSKTNSVSVQPI